MQEIEKKTQRNEEAVRIFEEQTSESASKVSAFKTRNPKTFHIRLLLVSASYIINLLITVKMNELIR